LNDAGHALKLAHAPWRMRQWLPAAWCCWGLAGRRGARCGRGLTWRRTRRRVQRALVPPGAS